jgi:hypothetical protein
MPWAHSSGGLTATLQQQQQETGAPHPALQVPSYCVHHGGMLARELAETHAEQHQLQWTTAFCLTQVITGACR